MLRFLCWVWLGLVLGVSFLAAPIKFYAPTLDLPTALDVGRVTFHLLNRIEWILSATLVYLAFLQHRSTRFEPTSWILTGAVLLIVGLQTFWMLPVLDLRVAAILRGESIPPSALHTVYIGVELAKVGVLGVLGAVGERAGR
ncbi:MAG: DUF4149 domain-containing protein [Acidobacteriota bacterium]|nr:DUF4149 domain-containing protein [Acidobacteriota bacterium]